MRERTVEAYLRKRVRETGGECYKFTSPGRRGVPDRMCVWPGNVVVFVEVKRPGEQPTAQQLREHKRMRKYGLLVVPVDTKIQAELLVKHYSK